MKVLFVSYNFPPSGGGGVQRPAKTVKYLARMGAEVHVLTKPSDGDSVSDQTLLEEVASEPNVFIHRPASIARQSTKPKKNQVNPRKRSGAMRAWGETLKPFLFECLHFLPDNRASWQYHAPLKFLELGIQPSAIYSSAMPIASHYVARSLSAKLGVPWVAEFRDLWVDNPYRNYRIPTKKWLDKILERRLLRSCFHAVVVAPHSYRVLSKYSFLEGKLSLIPNGYDPSDFAAPLPNETSISQTRNFVHTGRIYGRRSLRPILQAALAHLDSNSDDSLPFRFTLFGAALPLDHAEVFGELEARGAIYHAGYVDHAESIRAIRESDALVLAEPHKEPLTGKVWEYMACRKPILALAPKDGDLAKELRQYGNCYLAETQEEMQGEIRRLLDDLKFGSTENANEQYVLSRSREKQTSEIFDILLRAAQQ